MIRSGGGSITNVSSIASLRWSRYQFLSYNTSKAALNHFTRVIARQYAPHHVRANVIIPGLIDTPHAEALFDTPEAVEKARIERVGRCPLGRQGTAQDIANAAVFLASEEASYITGLEMVVDGGVTL